MGKHGAFQWGFEDVGWWGRMGFQGGYIDSEDSIYVYIFSYLQLFFLKGSWVWMGLKVGMLFGDSIIRQIPIVEGFEVSR